MKRTFLIFLVSILSMTSFSQFHWTKHPENPIIVPGAPGEWDDDLVASGGVMFYDSMYHMYYSGNLTGIGYATSPDGIAWTKHENNPVLVRGAAGEWDDYNISDAFVLKIDTLFHMWYTGRPAQAYYRIGHATSPDGIEWTKDVNNPITEIAEGLDANDYCMHAPVMYDGSLYHIYYETGDWNSSKTEVWHATSQDGYSWTRDPQNPVLEGALYLYASSLIFNEDQYMMYYGYGPSWEWKINLALSDDGSHWEQYENGPIINEGPPGSWDQKNINTAVVLFDSVDFKYRMWYTGDGKNGMRIGYAESDPRIPLLSVNSVACYGTKDTVIAKTNLDGEIYIVPDGTAPVIDSIIKNKLTSAEVTANTEVQIPFTITSGGRFNVFAVSKEGHVCFNPSPFVVLENFDPPLLEFEYDTVNKGDSIFVTSDKDVILYILVNNSVPEDTASGRLKARSVLTSNNPLGIPTDKLGAMTYVIYAKDECGIMSEAYQVRIEPEGTGIVNHTARGIKIFPNPSFDMLSIETGLADRYKIEITSLNGQEIYSGNMEGTTHQIDLSSFQKGVYFITISSKNLVVTSKIIKY